MKFHSIVDCFDWWSRMGDDLIETNNQLTVLDVRDSPPHEKVLL